MAGHRSHAGRNVLLTILVALVAYGGLLAWSAYNVRGHAVQAKARMQDCVAQIQGEELGAAYASARTAGRELSDARSELMGWQWVLASGAPVLGDDVRCAQQSTDVAHTLVQDAMLPVLGQASDLAGVDVESGGMEALASGFTRLSALMGAVSDARDVVANCKLRVASIPKAHVGELTELVASLSEAIDEADAALNALGALAS